MRLILFFRHVEHEQLLVHVDLRGGEADARRLVHGLEHIGDEAGQIWPELGHGLRLGPQTRVGKFRMVSLAMGLPRRNLRGSWRKRVPIHA